MPATSIAGATALTAPRQGTRRSDLPMPTCWQTRWRCASASGSLRALAGAAEPGLVGITQSGRRMKPPDISVTAPGKPRAGRAQHREAIAAMSESDITSRGRRSATRTHSYAEPHSGKTVQVSVIVDHFEPVLFTEAGVATGRSVRRSISWVGT